MVSYAKCPSHKLETGKRIRTTLGRYIRRHCSVGKDVLRDNLLGELCGYVFRAIEYSDATAPAYTILTGQAITEFDRFGPVSCMSGSSAHYTEFYAINPERVALVTERRLLRVLTDAGEEEMPLLARALLWTSGSIGCLTNSGASGRSTGIVTRPKLVTVCALPSSNTWKSPCCR